MRWPRLQMRFPGISPGLLLPIILLVALGLRLYGIDWDRGHGFHPDERSIYMQSDCMYRVLTEAQGYRDCIKAHPETEPGFPSIVTFFDPDKSPLNPHWFPLGSILIYLIVAIRFLVEPFTDMGSLLAMGYAGRSIMILADVGTVLMVYLLGRRVYSRGVGLLAAALVALAVVHIQHAHFYRPEPLLVFFLMASFWAMLRMVERRRLRDSLLLGLLVGLTVAPKVSVLPLVLPLAVAYGYRLLAGAEGGLAVPSWRQVARVAGHASAAGALAVVVFAITMPYALLDFGAFIDETTWQANMARTAGTVPFTVQYMGSTPFVYELKQTTVWALGLPLGVVAWGGLLFTGFHALRGGPARGAELLFLAWVVPNFLILGSFEVKFLRYIFPLMPFLILMGSAMLVWAVHKSRDLASQVASPGEEVSGVVRLLGRHLPKGAVAVMVVVILGTGLYALAFERVYASPHPAIQASRWINQNVPRGATVVTDNHWDEGIPDIYGYEVRQVPIYDPDTNDKMNTIAGHLSRGDYLVFYSNRTYGSVARVPERYPMSSRYYHLLFSEELGYVPEAVFTSYPRLLGVSLVDDTFGRAGISEPESLKALARGGVTLDLGYADENVINYDHPKVILFKNVEGLSQDHLFKLLTEGLPDEMPELGLMMDRELKQDQQEGGTWSEVISRDSWTNEVPVLAWLLLVELMYLAALPLALFLFRPLPDRGIVLARLLGILGAAYVAWLLASLGWMGFSRVSVLVGVLAMASLSVAVLVARWREIRDFVRHNWRLLAIGEVLFLVAFLAFVAVKAANPDLWHPYRGGEKPMDFAYLNAVLRSTYMPPYDPWFAGGYLNYYYWGQFVVAALIKATGIVPSVAYNLAVPLMFALTVTAAYSLVYNVTAGLRWLSPHPSGTPRPEGEGHGVRDSTDDASAEETPLSPPLPRGDIWGLVLASLSGARRRWLQGVAWGPVAAGLMAGLLVAVAGNLDQIAQVVRGGWNTVFRGAAFPSLEHLSDFWRSSRMLPQTEEVNPSALTFWLPDRLYGPEIGHHITEFPFFTFLFADLHAHLIVIPFTLLALGLAFSLLVGLKGGGRGWLMATVVALAVSLGALWAINSWDYPSYVLLALVLMGVAVYMKGGRPRAMAAGFVALGGGTVVLSILAFLPFHASYHPFPTGIDVARWQTPVHHFLGIYGLFLILIVSFLLYVSRRRLIGVLESVARPFFAGSAVPRFWDAPASPHPWKDTIAGLKSVSWAGVVAVAGVLAAVYLGAAGYWTAALLTLILVLAVWAAGDILIERRQSAPYAVLPLILITLGILIALGVEFVRVKDDIGRMNTLFKYYLEVWVLFALASAYILHFFARRGAFRLRRVHPARGLWLVLLLLALASSFMYPVLGTRSRLADRFDTSNVTLDGADYMTRAVYSREGPPIELRWDHGAIQWLQDNVRGSPVVLEAHAEQYNWSSRISDYTGLPTVLGWPWHQIQQRMRYDYAVRGRMSVVRELYTTTDMDRALELLTTYEVRYVVVGDLERVYYPPKGLDKFERMVQEGLARVAYENPGTRIYEGLWYN